MPRNPPWSRDELILALELYFRVNPIHTSEQHPEILALSNALNSLPIHPPTEQGQSFRNPTGVYMKLCNFLRFDPTYSGKGLTAGSKLDETIWHEFAGNKQRLQQVAAAILENSSHVAPPSTEEEVQSEYEAPEGQILTRIHIARERNQALVKKKKTLVLKSHGTLKCEVCRFDFEARYGVLGRGFAECHHSSLFLH